MKISHYILSLLSFTPLHGDSGGPYEFVPDLSDAEVSPVLQIPDQAHKLTYYLSNIPSPSWKAGEAEPSGLEWQEISDHYASLQEVGYVGGIHLFAVRYISKAKLEQGISHADSILIVGRQGNSTQFQLIYFTHGGASTYDHSAKLGTQGRSIALVVSRLLSGTTPITESITFERSSAGLSRPKK